MHQNLYKKIIAYLMQSSNNSSDAQMYLYGMECLIHEIMADSLLLFTACITHTYIELLLWNLSFIAIRCLLGGYHCASPLSCLIVSTILGGFSLILNKVWLRFPYVIFILMPVLYIFIHRYTPIIHRNHPLSSTQIFNAQKYIKINFVFIFVCSICLLFFNCHYFAPLISGIFEAVFLALITVLSRRVHQKT